MPVSVARKTLRLIKLDATRLFCSRPPLSRTPVYVWCRPVRPALLRSLSLLFIFIVKGPRRVRIDFWRTVDGRPPRPRARCEPRVTPMPSRSGLHPACVSVLVHPLTASKHELACPRLMFHQRQPATNNLIQSCASRDGRHDGRGAGARRLSCGLSVPLPLRSRLVQVLQLRSASEPSACSIRSRHADRSS